MRIALLLIALFTSFFFYSCHHEDSSIEYPYKAEVRGLNSDCGLYEIKVLYGLSEIESIVGSSVIEGIYIAKNLPTELEIEGLIISLDIRAPKNNELGVCTLQGPTYKWLYVIRAIKNER